MGEPVKIMDLAKQLIRFYGYEPVSYTHLLHQNIGAVDVLVQHRGDAAHLALDAAQPVGEGAVLLRGTQ